MCWYLKRFPDGNIELRPHGGLPEFAEVFSAFARSRVGAAIFCQHDANGGVTIYFPPVAAEFARMIQACEADKPQREGLAPLCCGSIALEHWFGQ